MPNAPIDRAAAHPRQSNRRERRERGILYQVIKAVLDWVANPWFAYSRSAGHVKFISALD